MKNQHSLPYVQDDGLPTQDVGSWAEDKYRLVNSYNRLFSRGMKNKWDCRVYVDLYAGNGRSKVRETEHILESSPLLALSVPDKFDKYIFCEKDDKKLEILKQRVTTKYSGVNVSYIQGDCNSEVDKIIAAIPRPSSARKVLSFCFVDPYNIGIKFETIEKLSELFMDFLIVLAGAMDANRNERNYTRPANKTVDTYLGINEWRTRWEDPQRRRFGFASFLASEYADQMERLRYI